MDYNLNVSQLFRDIDYTALQDVHYEIFSDAATRKKKELLEELDQLTNKNSTMFKILICDLLHYSHILSESRAGKNRVSHGGEEWNFYLGSKSSLSQFLKRIKHELKK